MRRSSNWKLPILSYTEKHCVYGTYVLRRGGQTSKIIIIVIKLGKFNLLDVSKQCFLVIQKSISRRKKKQFV